jgi:hypothetical protein
MGVGVGFVVRVFENDSDDCKEINISDQDNSLMSLFTDTTIKYTSITFDRAAALTEAENVLLKLSDDYEDFEDDDYDESETASTIMESAQALAIVTKIVNRIDREIYKTLATDIDAAIKSNIENEANKVTRNYMEFYSSLLILQGILKVTSVMGNKVQFVGMYY